MMRHVGDLLFAAQTFGDVLVGGNPASAWHDPVGNRDGAAVADVERPAADMSRRKLREQSGGVFFRITCKSAEPGAIAQQFGESNAGPRVVRLELVQVAITFVANNDAALRVEQQQPLRHVIDRGVKADILRAQLALAFFKFESAVGDSASEVAVKRIQFVYGGCHRPIGVFAAELRVSGGHQLGK